MTLMMQEILQEPETLKKAYETNRPIVEAIAKEMKKRGIKNIVTAARGSSDHACNFFKYICEIKAGIPVSSAAPSVVTSYRGKLDLSDTLVLGVSQSGKAADVMAVVDRAKECGAVTVNVTNNLESPMAKQAGYHLFLSATEEKSVAATKTMLCQMYVLSMLCAAIAEDAAYDAQLKALPDTFQPIYDMSESIREAALRYVSAADCYVLARGVNYAVAQETALKIQETTYIRAKAYAASDFHHGPFAVVDDKTRVILIAPKGESYRDMVEMAEKVKGVGADVTVITDDKALAAKYDAGIAVPEADDFMNAFYNTIVAQIFAQHLSLARGLNPDNPRGLNKVTITK